MPRRGPKRSTLPPLDSKRDSTGRRIPTSKQLAFAKVYSETRNATEAAMQAYNVKDRRVAGAVGTENLAKPVVRAEIVKLLKENDIEIGEILSVHKRNLVQDDHLPTSQRAVESFYDILGLKSNDKPDAGVKIAFIIEE